MTLLAEDLLLLLLDDVTGAQTLDGTRTDLVLGGALLLELALLGRVELTRDGPWYARERVSVADAAPLEDPLLEQAQATVAERPRGSQDLVGRLGKGLRARLLDRLEGRGVLERRSDRVLGLFPRTRWPAADSAHEDAVRARLHDVLVVGLTPDERTAALTALLLAVDKAHTVLPGLDGRERRAVKARAKVVAEGAWAADAVRSAVAAMQAAVAAGTVAATTAASSG
ncbi:GOLPH3/VPS74 family protein [Aquipuribacter hungaricus]|uniref:GPP34 family phosphoprotein n=1 Tax=Aquipuribacter hungaricus TaxID=545624 RepID=A0ABV7WFV3_9MICO